MTSDDGEAIERHHVLRNDGDDVAFGHRHLQWCGGNDEMFGPHRLQQFGGDDEKFGHHHLQWCSGYDEMLGPHRLQQFGAHNGKFGHHHLQWCTRVLQPKATCFFALLRTLSLFCISSSGRFESFLKNFHLSFELLLS